MQPVQLLSNAQLQRILFISSKRRTGKLDDNSSDVSKKRKSLNEIQPAISTANIFCQFGAGHEKHVGVGDTPGFECDPNSSITPEGNGFTKHLVFWSPRNTRRMVQTLMFLTQVWRGNVDVKTLLYQSDPSNPDPKDIVTCSDYLVGCQMKGAQTLAIERKNMKDLVMNMKDMYGNKGGVFSAAGKLLNRASIDRTISKQEAMCLLAQLPLVLCSERIEPVSLSHSSRICNQIEAKKEKTLEDTSWVTKNEWRTGNSTLCFHHYVTGKMNRKKIRTSKESLPHYTGSMQFCSFPTLETYCYQVLLAYKPWSKSNPLSNKQGKTYRGHF
jgi:hypothetical protein